MRLLIHTIVNKAIQMITIKTSVFAHCMIEKSYESCHLKIKIGSFFQIKQPQNSFCIFLFHAN